MPINNTMELIQFFTLSLDSNFTLNKQLLLKLGINKAVYITNLIDKYKYSLYHAIPKSDWFYESQENQIEELGMSKYSIRNCKKYFQKIGVLEIRKKIHSKNEYFTLDLSKLKQLLNEVN